MSARPLATLLTVLVATAAGCGGGYATGDIEGVAEKSAMEGAEKLALAALSAPSYLEPDLGEPAVRILRVRKRGEKAATVRGRLRIEANLRPRPAKARFLREVSAVRGIVEVVRPFTADVVNEKDGWTVHGGVDFDEPPRRELSPEDVEDARKLAVGAVRAILTYNGDTEAYDRAQAGSYATKLWSEAHFNQRGFDPAPTLVRRTKRGLSAWPRTNDRGRDDLSLGKVLRYAGPVPKGFDCSRAGVKLRSMRPRAVSGRVGTQGPIDVPGLVEQKVGINGRAVVRVANWICREKRDPFEGRKKVISVGPSRTRLEYRVTVSRLTLGTGEWFVSGVALSDRDEGFKPTLEANLYDTGSGRTRVLAAP